METIFAALAATLLWTAEPSEPGATGPEVTASSETAKPAEPVPAPGGDTLHPVSTSVRDSDRSPTGADSGIPSTVPRTVRESTLAPTRATRAEPRRKTASDRFCGPLPRDFVRWNPKEGALRLGGRVVIGPGQRLDLPPGTLVVADPDNSCRDSSGSPSSPALLVAGGTLRIAGTWRDPVVLRPVAEGSDLPWDGIQVVGAGEGEVSLRWFEVRRARVGINVSAGAAGIDHAVVEDCGIGLGVAGGAAPRISHSVFSRTRVADVASERSAPEIRSCLFLDGQGDGIRFSGTGLARVETSLFWGQRGTPVVRGPSGLGNWKADSLPDAFGNRRCDPVFRASRAEADSAARVSRENAQASWWKRRRLPPAPPGRGPWVPSVYSPLLEAGERQVGGRADIGLWDELRR